MSQNNKEKHFHNWKNTKFAGMAWILAILVLVIAIVLNMIISAGFQLGHFPEQTVQSEFYHRKVSGSAGQRGKDSRLLRSDHGREPEKRHGFSDAVPCAGRI